MEEDPDKSLLLLCNFSCLKMLEHSGQMLKDSETLQGLAKGIEQARKSQALYWNSGCLFGVSHTLLLPLNFRSITSPADFSESFQELKAQREFECSTGFNPNHLAGMSPFCFGNRLHGLSLGNSSLFCSC